MLRYLPFRSLLAYALPVQAQEIKVAIPEAKPAIDVQALEKKCARAIQQRYSECMKGMPPFTGNNTSIRNGIVAICESERRATEAQCKVSIAAAKAAIAE